MKRDKKRILSCFTDEFNNVGPLLQKGCDLVIIRNKYIHTDHQMNQSAINNVNRNSPESFVSDSENDNRDEINLIENLQTIFTQELRSEISLSNLSELLGSKDLFPRVIREKTIFHQFTLDKLEEELKKNLKNDNLLDALDSIRYYRILKGYKIEGIAPNQAEIELINSLRISFANELGAFISLSKLSEMILSKDTIPQALRKKYPFKKFTIDKIEMLSQRDLTGENLRIALDGIGFNTEDSAPNQAEIDLIEVLKELFSAEFKKPISMTNLSRIIASERFLGTSLTREGKFTRYSINKMKEAVEENLTNINQERAQDTIDEYSILKGY